VQQFEFGSQLFVVDFSRGRRELVSIFIDLWHLAPPELGSFAEPS
jgi:hypothetical protein